LSKNLSTVERPTLELVLVGINRAGKSDDNQEYRDKNQGKGCEQTPKKPARVLDGIILGLFFGTLGRGSWFLDFLGFLRFLDGFLGKFKIFLGFFFGL
jgi:hypothetical protein